MLTEKKANPPRYRWIRVTWNIIGQLVMVVALYFLAGRLIENGNQVIHDLRQMAMNPVIGAILLTLLMLLLMPLGWTCAFYAVGIPVSFRLGFIIYYRVSILRYLPGSIWNYPGRAYLCKQQGIPLSAFGASTFLELYFLLVIAGTFSGCGLALSNGNPALMALCIIVTCILLGGIVWIYPWLTSRLKKTFGLEISKVENLHKRFLLAMVLIYSIVWISYGVAIMLLLLALPGTLLFEPMRIILLSVAAWAGGFLSPSPAGLGVREFGLSMLLGPDLATMAVVVSLTQRVMEVFLEGLLWIFATVSKI